jgi:hypothetical protein
MIISSVEHVVDLIANYEGLLEIFEDQSVSS